MRKIVQRALDAGLTPSEDPIQPGDLYLAERNTGPQLLTCKYVHPRNWIVPIENAYSYDTWECVKIVGASK
jgi:hypothetical protein